MIPGYNAKSYPEGRVIANSIEWDDVYSVYVLGNNGKFEKVVREKCSERGESCESQTLDEYLKGMKEKYGIEPVTAKDRDISFSDLSKYSIPEEIKKIVEACYQLRMKQKGENNISK